MHRKFQKLSIVMAGAMLAALAVALPAEASGGPSGSGGTSGGGGGGGGGGAIQTVAATTLSASLVGAPGFASVGGTINVVPQPRTALSGDITNTGLPTGTVVDLLINGAYIQSEPIFPAAAQIAPGGTLFTVERLPGKAANLTAPLLQFLSTLQPGATVVVRETSLTLPPGFLVPVPLSPNPGAVVATGTLH